MIRDKGLGIRLALYILTSIVIIFSFIFAYNYLITRRLISKKIESNAEYLTLATVNRIDAVLHSLEKVPENLRYFLESYPYDRGDIYHLIQEVIKNNPEIYGATVAFEPYKYDSASLQFAPYFYKSDGRVNFKNIPYEYFYWDWYQIPKELDHPAWTEPYFDEGAGEVIMATYSVPFYKTISGKKTLVGVVTSDISLDWLQRIVASIRIGQTGYGFLITRNGTFVTHPNTDFIMNETIFSVAEARADAGMRELGRKMIRGESGFVPFRSVVSGKDCWMVYAPLSSNGWSLAVLFPKDELMAAIYSLNRVILLLGIAGFFVILLVIFLISNSITRPLRALARATGHIATGDLDVDIPPAKTRDEVGKLTDSFEYMKTSLKQYIEELRETTASKERIESELQIARDIQMGILTKLFPPFPDKSQFDIYAVVEPAREVGGDLYEFFFMDEDRLCFAVGDVSGKGVPAALFMAIIMTLIRTRGSENLSTDAILSIINRDLSTENPSLMFVTLFLGILNVRTGELEYSNGGHNPPYVIHSDGEIKRLEATNGIALGVMQDHPYQSRKMVLKKGESIFVYTDGVTEALNERGDFFSEERMKRELALLKDRPVEEIVDGMLEKIRIFSQGEPQTDDITMMILRFKGN